MKVMIRERKRLLGNVALMSEYFRMRLSAMHFAKPATLRILGLAIAIEFKDEKYAEKLGERCRDNGLLLSPEGKNVLLIPALDIDQDTARAGLDILERCVAR